MPCLAEPPRQFTESNTDVIPCSSDGHEFKVHKIVFDRLDLAIGGARDRIPVVNLTENEKTVKQLLQLCYPMDDPEIELRREEVRHTLGDLPEELEGISPDSLYRLLKYQERVLAEVVDYLVTPTLRTFTDEFDINPVDWGFDDEFEGVFLPGELCRQDHSGHSVEPRRAVYRTPSYVRIDDPHVLLNLVKQVKCIQDVHTLRVPRELYSSAETGLKCDDCLEIAKGSFDKFFICLRESAE
ncbi:hypothetical protein C8Q79DRAFT_1013506 [Trametes meyenii]|nr:hypothetical protein C8Q79DRAFT_1013506 [Trametes meyenii]